MQEALESLDDATAELVAAAGLLTDADARAGSLLPGWTRGHLLTHVARNAEGGARLLGWARTGIPGLQYPSVAARAAAIEEGAGRPAAVLAADVRATAAAFAEAAAAVPPGAWQNPVTWTTGRQTPAEMIVLSRLGEVLIHHVDLGTGFGAGSWPEAFVREMLGVAVRSLGERTPAPMAVRLRAVDTGRDFQIGDPAGSLEVSGAEGELLAWLLGRSDGAGLGRDTPGPLPPLPSVYFT